MRGLSNVSSTHLQLKPRPSRCLTIALWLLHLLALLPVFLLSLPVWATLVWCLALLLHGLSQIRRYKRQLALTTVSYGAGGWRLAYTDGTHVPAQLASWFAHPRLCILRFVHPRCSLALPYDALTAEEHRRLRVLLRLQDPRQPAAEAEP
nr:protein YgfX [Alkalilimnicola ehrlichii]